MKKDVTEIFARCARCGGIVMMTTKQHKKWEKSGQPAICVDCKLLPPDIERRQPDGAIYIVKKRHGTS